MTITTYNNHRDLIMVAARIWGREGFKDASLVLDTGSCFTIVTPLVIEALGYHPRDGVATTTVRTAIGKEHGYTLTVPRFEVLGARVSDFEVHVFDLATGYDIDGLIGLDFLGQFDVELLPRAGQIALRPASSRSLSRIDPSPAGDPEAPPPDVIYAFSPRRSAESSP